MKRFWIACLLLLLPLLGQAQTFRTLSVEEGLSSRRVFGIQKGHKGYIWLLTHDGIDRFDGKEVKHYQLFDGQSVVSNMMEMSRLERDSRGGIWEVSQRGTLYHYRPEHDRFELMLSLTGSSPVTCGCIDANDQIWICSTTTITRYDITTQRTSSYANPLHEAITELTAYTDSLLFAGTESGVKLIHWNGEQLREEPIHAAPPTLLQVNELYYHEPDHKLYIGTYQRGLYCYDVKHQSFSHISQELIDVSINRICPWDDHTLFIATDGAGVYRMDTHENQCTPFLKADYQSPNAMNGNNILDLYIDESQRLWMANYPIGVTICDLRQPPYDWLKHAIGNSQSLVNDQVNNLMEDSDGDLWMATNNGVSLYNRKQRTWRTFLSEGSGERTPGMKSHTFLSLCEVRPGLVWVGGYSSGLYQIHKQTGQIINFTPSSFSGQDIRPDKYIRAMLKDRDGLIWSGGLYNLKVVDITQHSVQLYPELSGITALVEHDAERLWVGTSHGLYLLHKQSHQVQEIELPITSCSIYSLCQSPDGRLFIGTNCAGLFIYTPSTGEIDHYHKDNCALISNSIYTLICNGGEQLLMTTEGAVTFFNPDNDHFTNWTREQGLSTDHFNASSGLLTRDGYFVLGSTEGVLLFNKQRPLPPVAPSKLVLSDLAIFYQQMSGGEKGSPLTDELDLTSTLYLKHNQNFFSIKVSSINYDAPSQVLYTWRLEGFYDHWTQPDEDGRIRITNLSPGQYTLRIRAISNEDRHVILEERRLEIIVAPPFWSTSWAYALYLLLSATLIGLSLRYAYLRKQRRISKEKIQFFINTAHDIRTPLTLIKAPLEELQEKEPLSEEGQRRMQTALRNVNALLHLATNLIRFERIDTYSERLHVERCDLKGYLNETLEVFRPFAESHQLQLTLTTPTEPLHVWMDREKMDSILKNLLSNALKYTPDGGRVEVNCRNTEKEWVITVKDSGIGIPAAELKKIFRTQYRASNAINAKVTGSGIGLLMVKKLVKLHKGKLQLNSKEGTGTTVQLTFPLSAKAYSKALLKGETSSTYPSNEAIQPLPPLGTRQTAVAGGMPTLQEQSPQQPADAPLLLIAEDNDELRQYLAETLGSSYRVIACANGTDALQQAQEQQPQLIISDIMMPGLRGDALCKQLKGDLNTSHIPVVLLTALANEQEMINGLQCGADDYLTKPFHLGVLMAKIESILANRERIKRWLTSVEDSHALPTDSSSTTAIAQSIGPLDEQFITNVRSYVEQHMADTDFNVDNLCSQLCMSRTSVYNKIKALTDESPADYMRLIRLQQAARLLREQHYTVSEIAERTGFNDAKYFREVFKKYYHLSPSQYAQEQINNEKNTQEIQ